METFCLVLAGDGDRHDPTATRARLAEAFGMPPAGFDEAVWQRVPLAIRTGLDRDTADALAMRLQATGAQAAVEAEDGQWIWLLRGERVLGPLPSSARARYHATGDRWCLDGEAQWRDSEMDTVTPPPLPAMTRRTTPPALPARRRHRAWRWAAGLAGLLLAVGVMHWLRTPAPPAPPVRYVPRPLQPLPTELAQASPACADGDARPAASEEDHFLVAGGRELGAISARDGEDYVAAAVIARDAACRASALQLYAFHRGVFVGALLDAPLDPRRDQLAGIRFVAEGLRYAVRRCEAGTACDTREQLLPWRRDGSGGGDADAH